MKIWRVVCQEHAYFTAPLCNVLYSILTRETVSTYAFRRRRH